jgi:C-3',4' desaturase CrtD
MYDVAVIGAGVAGLATAARLQARGLSTVVFEAHGQPGGCAGYFRRCGFAFDVGATTLVDFEAGGVGGELLDSIGLEPVEGEALPGYRAWLPDRCVTLHRDPALWATERLDALGDTPAHRRLWQVLDRLARVFWSASRRGIKLPLRTPGDLARAASLLVPWHWPLARYVRWTVGDLLRRLRLREDRPLCGLLAMLLEDTVHARLDDAPLINGALGITIRGAGLTRARGGMFGFWRRFVAHYRASGGVLRVGCPVERVESGPSLSSFLLHTRRGVFPAGQVVSAVPAALTARLAPRPVAEALRPFLARDAQALGGALVVFLGVPEEEVAGQTFTHHQLLQDYGRPLGNGNNMFVSVSAAGDTLSAPAGHRAVMISTHCELADWEGLSEAEYRQRKEEAGEQLIGFARRVYPDLGRAAVVREVATPCTYERFTRRPRGAVGGVRQSLANSNQNALPHDLGVPGFWLVGDTTWPGLGTVACVLGSRIVAEGVLARAHRGNAGRATHGPASPSHPVLPTLDELGRDLLRTTRQQRWLALVRPFLGLAGFAVAAYLGWWWLTPLIVFLIFVAVVTATHDVVHESLGLGPWATEVWLFVLGALLLESGHAYRATHLRHHRAFPGPDDPEGDPARMSFWGALLWGPVFLPRLWWWAFHRLRGRAGQRLWLAAEAGWALGMVVAGLLLWPATPAVAVYVLLAVAGSWVYPLLTVHLPHRHYGDHPLTQTGTLRGRLIPAVFLELTYHLEHHLYPAVPSHHYPELSRRLEPVLLAHGVRPTRVP